MADITLAFPPDTILVERLQAAHDALRRMGAEITADAIDHTMRQPTWAPGFAAVRPLSSVPG